VPERWGHGGAIVRKTSGCQEAIMGLRFVGIGADAGTASSPTIWIDDAAELVIPGRMIPAVREAGSLAERTQL
jgi:hypothetical protein